LGGFVVQYILTGSGTPPPFNAKYAFFTQETIGAPGVARTTNDAPTATYDENVTSDYWAIGSLDDSGGERGNDYSKRVVFNSNLAVGSSCAAGPFEQPLLSGNPLFKSNQDIKIAFSLNGTGCASGTLHVSIVRITG